MLFCEINDGIILDLFIGMAGNLVKDLDIVRQRSKNAKLGPADAFLVPVIGFVVNKHFRAFRFLITHACLLLFNSSFRWIWVASVAVTAGNTPVLIVDPEFGPLIPADLPCRIYGVLLGIVMAGGALRFAAFDVPPAFWVGYYVMCFRASRHFMYPLAK